MEFDSNKIESNSIGVEFDSMALKQGFLRLRLDFCFLILTDRKNTYKIYLLNKLCQSQVKIKSRKKTALVSLLLEKLQNNFRLFEQ